MGWYTKLRAWPQAGSDYLRAKYARKFMFKYAAAPNWYEMFDKDSAPLFEMVSPQRSAAPSHKRHESTPGPSTPKSGPPGKKVKNGALQLCFTRTRQHG